MRERFTGGGKKRKGIGTVSDEKEYRGQQQAKKRETRKRFGEGGKKKKNGRKRDMEEIWEKLNELHNRRI